MKWAIAVAQFRSLRQAAEKLNVRQSTLSRRMGDLEQEVGATLFERTNGGTPKVEAARSNRAGCAVRAMAIRLPQVHGGDGKAGLITYVLEIARQKGVVAYVGDGSERSPSAHRLDVARLYRLALENGVADGVYHAVAEEGVPMRQVADVLGRALKVPVTSIKKEEAGAYFGPLAMLAGLDLPASSDKTQAELGWKPTEIGLIADIGQPGYFNV